MTSSSSALTALLALMQHPSTVVGKMIGMLLARGGTLGGQQQQGLQQLDEQEQQQLQRLELSAGSDEAGRACMCRAARLFQACAWSGA